MKKVTIILDEGHYQGYPGKCSPIREDGTRLYEWEFAKRLGEAIKRELDLLGIKCIIANDSYSNTKSLTARAKDINKIVRQESELGNNSLMISLHGNAAGNGDWMKGRGWEVWTTEGTTNSDKFAKILCDKFKEIFPDQKLRGHKEKNFTIIYATACPCVLTENFFYDNKQDLELMTSEDGFRRLVALHVESIKQWIEF